MFCTLQWFGLFTSWGACTLETPDVECGLAEKLDQLAVRMLILKLYHTHGLTVEPHTSHSISFVPHFKVSH